MMGTDLVPVPADLRTLTTITCQGRTLDHQTSQPTSDPCGATITAAHHHHGNLLDNARAAGWRIGHRTDGTPDAMCPRCAAPDPDTLTHLRDLRRSVQP